MPRQSGHSRPRAHLRCVWPSELASIEWVWRGRSGDGAGTESSEISVMAALRASAALSRWVDARPHAAFRCLISGTSMRTCQLFRWPGSVSEKQEHAPSRPASPAKNSHKSNISARVVRLLGAGSPLLGRAPGVIGIVLCTAAAVYAQPQPPRDRLPQQTGTGRIKGRVVDAQTGS